jgi:hypothetical protein
LFILQRSRQLSNPGSFRAFAHMAQTSSRPPWKRANPRKKSGRAATKLTPDQKARAKERAKRAGRKYPNLVDNMRVAAESKRRRKR